MIEFLPNVFNKSTRIVLDFAQIHPDTPVHLNIKKYFDDCERKNINPREPANRQEFNNRALELAQNRYLIGIYAENRHAMLSDTSIGREGRTYHMGIDIFCSDQPNVIAPCDGEIIRSSFEEGFGGYGNYILFKTTDNDLLLFGHLANNPRDIGIVKQGDVIGRVGDFMNGENGGWSRHLHLQRFTHLPANNETPNGYVSIDGLTDGKNEFPDPLLMFPDFHIANVTS